MKSGDMGHQKTVEKCHNQEENIPAEEGEKEQHSLQDPEVFLNENYLK